MYTLLFINLKKTKIMRKTLPKKWCVKNLGTKEFKCLIDYANSKGALPPYFLNNSFFF